MKHRLFSLFYEMKTEIDEFRNRILSKQSFVITTHINPDGDAIGSEVALARFLTDMGKTVHILNQSETPDNLLFLTAISPVITYREEMHAELIITADCFIVVDTNSTKRFTSLVDAFRKTAATKVIIDHHLDHEPFADVEIIDTSVPATCELLYSLLHAINSEGITTPIATALYAGIMTDTQSFKLPLTDSHTHTITADLLRRGVLPYDVYQEVYENGEINKLRLLGSALNAITLHYGGAVAVMTLPRNIFVDTNTKESDVDNLTQYVLSIRGVKIGIVITELEHGIKISFRSKNDIPITDLAKLYGGGGHRNAAGARVERGSLPLITSDVLKQVQRFL